MKQFFTCLIFIGVFSSLVVGQECPTGFGDTDGAIVSNGTNHQIYLEWPDAAGATAMNDALKGGAAQVAVLLNGYVNFGAANEEIINNVELSKAELTIPGTNPFRIRSTVPVTTNENGKFTGTVTFYFNAASGGGSKVCTFSVGVLPITLTGFNAIKEEKSVLLKWQTAQEINNDYMVVERSTDGRTFTEIGRLPGAGQSTILLDYEWKDTQPSAGQNYYRLRQVDFDGTIYYSTVESVNFRPANSVFSVYPSLISGEPEVKVDLTNLGEEALILDLFNTKGQLVHSYPVEGGSVQKLSTVTLKRGMYILKGRGLISLSPIRIMKIQ